MRALALAITGMELPAIEKISEAQAEDPFQVLIATLLSARTQDATTAAASTRLFKRARTPRTMASLTVKEIERLIYPVSFYRNKARFVKATATTLVDEYGGRVPSTMEEMTEAAGCRQEDREPGADPRLQEPAEHLRRHARPPHLEPARLGQDAHARRRPSRRSTERGRALVAVHQPVSGHLGAECLPSGVSALRILRAAGSLPPSGRRQGRSWVEGPRVPSSVHTPWSLKLDTRRRSHAAESHVLDACGGRPRRRRLRADSARPGARQTRAQSPR